MLFFYNPRCVLFIPNCHMNIPDCHMNITIYFFYNSGWVLFIFDCHLDITGVFFSNSGWALFIPSSPLATQCGMAWTTSSQAIHIVQCTGYVKCKCVTMYCVWAPLPNCKH